MPLASELVVGQVKLTAKVADMQQGNAAPLRSNTDSSSATAAGSAVDAGGAADSGEGAEGQGAHGGQSTLAVKLPLGGLERSLPVPGWTMSEAHAPQGTA